jgi:hypothetical protein
MSRLVKTSLRVTLSLLILAAFADPARAQDAGAGGVTGALSGYMDFHYNKADREDGRLDFHRFVLLVSHAFSPRLRFVG